MLQLVSLVSARRFADENVGHMAIQRCDISLSTRVDNTMQLRQNFADDHRITAVPEPEGRENRWQKDDITTFYRSNFAVSRTTNQPAAFGFLRYNGFLLTVCMVWCGPQGAASGLE
ncbi:hypothetical protein QZQ97_18055 [Serratia sp. root2]|uniref:hypothetical protein n=1 Tax=Serratia sp. root2 TaxID=3059676 RepID=UPI00288F90D9|nr:hypothetical protein [Serratia sp. root2]MDT3252823.1 hypothetical protein [Serratia sp. root2]